MLSSANFCVEVCALVLRSSPYEEVILRTPHIVPVPTIVASNLVHWSLDPQDSLPISDGERLGAVSLLSRGFLYSDMPALADMLLNAAHDGSTSAPQNVPLSIVLSTLAPVERDFFDALDKELEKIESFYRARESEGRIR